MRDRAGTTWVAALAGRTGRDYWRGLEELLDTPAFREAVAEELPGSWRLALEPGNSLPSDGEFPGGAAEWSDGLTRRGFFRLLGAGATLAGVAGCTEPPREPIVPYVERPVEVTPGLPLHYATSMAVDGFATGLVVESHVGRPTKVEGNPDHPASLGASGAYEQASVLQLYDPSRARAVSVRGKPSTWDAFVEAFGPDGPHAPAAAGEGLRFLLEPTGSPLLAVLLDRIRERYPRAGIHFYAPLAAGAPLEASRVVFGRPLMPQFDFRRADVILALDSDFLAGGPFHLRYARHFTERRRVRAPSGNMNRLYAVEPMLTPTGAMADHRLAVRGREVRDVAGAVLAEVVLGAGLRPGGMLDDVAPVLERLRGASPHRGWAAAVGRDLAAHRGAAVVVAGDRQPPAVHAMAHLLNAALGSLGRTVTFTGSPLLDAGASMNDLRPLVEAMRAGAVQTLVILEGNPAYASPADLEFGRWLGRVPTSVYLGLYRNETARASSWFVPAAHYLEAWGDARAFDGTLSLGQPLVAPLFGGRTPAEVLAVFLGQETAGAHGLLREVHRGRHRGRDFEAFWEAALKHGLVDGTALPAEADAWRWEGVAGLLSAAPTGPSTGTGTVEVNFLQDPSVYDGRFTNNAWLLEWPDPMTKLTWGNAAILSPRTAVRLGVESEEVVRLRYRGRDLAMPVLVLPGHADDAVSLHFGYGREGEERVALGVGANAYALWASGDPPYLGPGLAVERLLTPRRPKILGVDQPRPVRQRLALTQEHWPMHGRPIVLHATLAEYRRDPDLARRQARPAETPDDPSRHTGDQWAMAIDLTACTGCSACVLACQAENNIPVVGKAGVEVRREMHWLRVDRYYVGPPEAPRVVVQPMLCQHCERAPCEYVCPVNATVHSPDGLNEMVYNRCVGTRFCSNNCPYKVRRFNWFDYNADRDPLEQMPMNPEVTVRARGVMEKCTYCVQRIRRAQIAARLEGRRLREGEFTTACAQACPTQAIVFGSLGDPGSAVSALHRERLAYSVLHDLGTRPRTKYLARLTNPNPELG
jgi:MoCo/4Fe-4S cofactor protein with predicted Tat translocation signal